MEQNRRATDDAGQKQGLETMARFTAAERTAWNDHDHAQHQDGGELDGAVTIMGRDERPIDPRELFVRIRAG